MRSTFIASLALLTAFASDPWQAKNYHQNSSSQKDAASDLMREISLSSSESILDIGCGDGKITAVLAQKVSSGSVLGVDISPSMVDFSKATFSAQSNLEFKLMGAEEIDFNEQFDLVTSFTALQWVSDHALVIHKSKQALKKGGRLAFTMPMGLPQKLAQAVEEIKNLEQWRGYFAEFETGWHFPDKAKYHQWLKAEGLTEERLEVVHQCDIFPSPAAFKGFISQWFPYLRPLPSDMKETFMDAVLARFIELEPLDEAGRLHFKIERLEVIARK